MSENDILDLGPETDSGEESSRGLWKRLKRGLMMSHTEVLERIDAALAGRSTIDAETLEDLEEALIGADIGVDTALELVDALKRDAKGYFAGDPLKLRQRLVDEMAVLLLDAPQPP
ncbi:MAG TPA: signal recognition particle receptor subunit alpha, partial [Thermoanaerobaculia bacterium]|nr:signal recognition particle receptor subunit alpha [Thermoanaerobaculia bacterium]